MKSGRLIIGTLVLAMVILFAQTSVSVAGSILTPGQVSSYKQAKASKQLVEVGNGYLKPGSGMDSALVPLMDQVNQLRKEKYRAIARKNGVPLRAVEKSAGRRLSGR